MSDFVLVPRPSGPSVTEYALASLLTRYRDATLRAYQPDLLAFLRWCAARQLEPSKSSGHTWSSTYAGWNSRNSNRQPSDAGSAQ